MRQVGATLETGDRPLWSDIVLLVVNRVVGSYGAAAAPLFAAERAASTSSH